MCSPPHPERDSGRSPIPVSRIPDDIEPLAALSPETIDQRWLSLRQTWRPCGPHGRVQPGWARMLWSPEALLIDTLFCGGPAMNRATRLNQPTWELGDVAEVFLEESGDVRYVEVHVTPENQRLQLTFAHGEIERLRAGEVTLASFLVNDPAWVASETSRIARCWSVRLRLPASCFGRGPFIAGRRFRGTFCRYDCGQPGSAVVSATAPLTAPDFHRRDDWDELLLVDAT